ncbi:MAG: sigma-70 family RNA polymerase sigma factor, partial [Smithellaceae bacterium]|nr:sigma-70 family RNA polymerase sigma factor [Smithellaceae bacterium]
SDLLESLPSRNPSPEKLYEAKESLHAVQSALQGISPKLRAALVLKEVEELSYEEIADVLDISVGTVKSRISRAREELMKILRNKRKRETLKG